MSGASLEQLQAALQAARTRELVFELVDGAALGLASEGPRFCAIALRAQEKLAESKAELARLERLLAEAQALATREAARAEEIRLQESAEPLSDGERHALAHLFEEASKPGARIRLPLGTEAERWTVHAREASRQLIDGSFANPSPRGRVAYEIRRLFFSRPSKAA